MRRLAAFARANFSLPLTLTVLSLVGLQPFTHTSLSSSFDGLLHLHRLVELNHLLTQGVVYPRWAPDLVFGFGFPIFNFYAPLAYYIAATIHRLGMTLADTATVFFVLCTLSAALAMHRLASELTRSDGMHADNLTTADEKPAKARVAGKGAGHAALVAALAYVYAPTHIYDNFYRSAWGTVLAYAIAPWLLSEIAVWYRTGRSRTLGSLALGTAGLMLAHNVSALLTMPLLGAALLAFLPLYRGSAPFRALAVGVLAMLCGFGISAFFWLPALVETQYVQTWRLTIPPDFDFRNHFLTVADWFAWPAPAAVGRINPDLVNTLGPIQGILAIAGVMVVAVRVARSANGGPWQVSRRSDEGFARRQAPLHIGDDVQGAALRKAQVISFGLFALSLSASLFLTLPLSQPVWESISFFPTLQFPHRFITVSALCAAVLSAAVISALPAQWQARAALVACALLIITSIPFLYPRPQPASNPNPGLGDVLAHERKTGALGTTASGEYFPIWVKFIPRSSPFEEAIVNGENPQRFEARSLPQGGRVLSQTAEPYAFALSLTSPQEFTATFRHFYFPGWQGYVDGLPVTTVPSEGQGFSAFRVPAGEHRIALRLDSTPVRDAAGALSWLSLAVGVAAITALRWVGTAASQRTHQSTDGSRFDALLGLKPYLILGSASLLLKIGIIDNFNTPLRVSFDGLHAPGLQYAQPASLGGVITSLGYSLPGTDVAQGDTVELTLFWMAQREVSDVYSSFAQLVDAQFNLYAQKDNLHPGGTPTTTWRANEYNVDRHPIAVPPGTPPGEYRIAVGLYNGNSGARLLRDRPAADQPIDQLLIGPITVRRRDAPLARAAYGIRVPLERPLSGGIRLLGLSAEKDRLPSDDFLRIALFWQAERAPLAARRMSLRLLDAAGRTQAEHAGAPSNDRYPTTQWSAGEIVRDNRALWIPRSLPAGDYRLWLSVEGEAEPLELGSIRKP